MVLPFAEHGPAGAPTILFLHGGGVGAWMWTPQVGALSADYHCLVPSLPGHDSTPTIQPFTMDACADAVAELIRRQAHGGTAHVVGLSLGSQVATALLRRAPELILTATLSGCLAKPLPGLGSVKWMLKWTQPLARYDWWVKANMKQAAIPEAYLPQVRQDGQRISVEALASIVQANGTYGLPPGLERVQVPTLFVVGAREKGLMHQSLKALLAAMPAARGAVSEGVGHTWNLQEPARFVGLVRSVAKGGPLPAGVVEVARG